MKVTASELKNRLGKYLDIIETEAVEVTKSGHEKAVLISRKHYDAWQSLKESMENSFITGQSGDEYYVKVKFKTLGETQLFFNNLVTLDSKNQSMTAENK